MPEFVLFFFFGFGSAFLFSFTVLLFFLIFFTETLGE